MRPRPQEAGASCRRTAGFVRKQLVWVPGSCDSHVPVEAFHQGAVGGMCASCGCPGADEQTEREDADGEPGADKGTNTADTWAGREPDVVRWETKGISAMGNRERFVSTSTPAIDRSGLPRLRPAVCAKETGSQARFSFSFATRSGVNMSPMQSPWLAMQWHAAMAFPVIDHCTISVAQRSEDPLPRTPNFKRLMA